MEARTFIGRQPIVDRDRHVVAYELLFRSSRAAQSAVFDEVGRAAVRVMVNTFASLGMEAVLGSAKGFFNVNREILLSEAIEALPRERVVIEVLEDVEATDDVVERCRALRADGFQVALDDWVVGDRRAALLPHADLVKVDLPAVATKGLRKLVRELRAWDLQLLAEKVETVEEYELCAKLGFDLFQGYFFAKPIVLEGADLDATKTTLIEVMQLIANDAETQRIVETFKQDAKLGLNLLRLVNTAGMAARVRLETIEDAVRHVGLLHLGRWVAILLYAQGDAADMRSPLLISAAHRGRLMESLASESARSATDQSDDPVLGEKAFMAGMLSMADALLGRPLETLVTELCLSDEIASALLARDGELGLLLTLAEAIERGEVDKFEPVLDARAIGLADLQRIENESYAWVHGLIGVPID